MQNNRFVHEDIKAVCNSATKKLVVLGLVASIGVGVTVAGGWGDFHTASAQSVTQDKQKLNETLKLFLSAITLAEFNPQKSHELMEFANNLSPENKRLFEESVNAFLQHYSSTGQIDAEAIRIFANVLPLISPEFETESDLFPSAVAFIEEFLQAGANDRRRYLAGRLSYFGYHPFVSQSEAVFERLERGYGSLAAQARDNPDIVDSDEFIMELFNLRRDYVREGLVFLSLEESETRREALSLQNTRLFNSNNVLEQELRVRANDIDRLNNIIRTNHRDANSDSEQMIQARGKPENGGRQTITGNTMLQVRGTNHIEAWSDTHIHSLSDNELLHEGNGAVNVDRGDIIISDFSNGQETRDVTLNEANSLTVAPGITTRIHNGTEFRIGATVQETAEHILRALTPISLLNVLNRFTNQNTTNDEMEEERGDERFEVEFREGSFI